MLQRLQENEKKLAKEDHAKKSAALDDLARQFDERLKLMEKERGKEATGIEAELMRLQDEISRTKDAAMKQELEKRVSKLEAAQEQLMDEYEFRQEILREQQMIMRSVSYSTSIDLCKTSCSRCSLGARWFPKASTTPTLVILPVLLLFFNMFMLQEAAFSYLLPTSTLATLLLLHHHCHRH